MDVTPSTQQCYPITLQNFAAFVCNNSITHHDQICKRLLSEPITASTNHKAHKETVLDGENELTHFRPIRSAILRDGVTWCYPIRFPTVEIRLRTKSNYQSDCKWNVMKDSSACICWNFQHIVRRMLLRFDMHVGYGTNYNIVFPTIYGCPYFLQFHENWSRLSKVTTAQMMLGPR